MRLAVWNVANGGERRLPLLERVDADVLLMLGVSRTSASNWADRWDGRYHFEAGLFLTDSPQERPHGSMIASRWPLRDAYLFEWLPRPERGLATITQHPTGPLTLIAWGAPNAAGEGREAKEAAYARMTETVPQLGTPLAMGVDTNAWEDAPLGGAEFEPDPAKTAQQDFTGRQAPHGLLDVHRHLVDADPERSRLLAAVRPYGPLAVTYIRRPRGQPRRIVDRSGPAFGLDRMDRLYISSEITPLACEHFYDDSIAAGSDHAMVLASLSVPPTDGTDRG